MLFPIGLVTPANCAMMSPFYLPPERTVCEAQPEQPDPGGGPTKRLFMPDLVCS